MREIRTVRVLAFEREREREMVVFTRACDGECESGGQKCPLRLVFGKRPNAGPQP